MRFATAPAWFRGVLTAEDLVLGRLRGRLPTTAHLDRTRDLTDPAAIPRPDVGTCFEVLEHVRDPDRLPETVLGPLSTLKRRVRAAGARRFRTYHQHFRRPDVRRRAAGWHGTWLLDAAR